MAAIETPTVDLEMPAPNFRLKGVDGNEYSLEEARGPNGVVVMFICNHCPFVKAVIDRIVRDAEELKTHGIGSIAVMSNDVENYPDDSFANMQKFAELNHFGFPYVYDESQDVAKAYGAVCTPDFFGFDKDLKLQYRGRLDDSGREAKAAAHRDLFDAMVQVARTGKAPPEQKSSIGCSIKWKEAA